MQSRGRKTTVTLLETNEGKGGRPEGKLEEGGRMSGFPSSNGGEERNDPLFCDDEFQSGHASTGVEIFDLITVMPTTALQTRGNVPEGVVRCW